MTDSRSEIPPIDLEAAARMWADYAAAHPDAVSAAGGEHTVEAFGDSAELADELLELVLTAGKRATAELASEFTATGEPLPRIGSHWIACDGAGHPRIVIRSLELRLGDLTSVDEAFARDEAEGDRSLETWRAGHRRYWVRTSAARGSEWSESDEIVFERFAVVWPPDFAD